MRVTVVGAGIVGCAAAYELAARGAHVEVVDARGIGLGATHASAGMLAPRIEGHSASMLRLTLCGLASYDVFVDRLRSEVSRDFVYERSGTLQVALDADEQRVLEVAARQLADTSVPHSLLDGAGAREFEPSISPGASGALFIPEHGFVSVASFLDAVVESCRTHDVVFHTAYVSEVSADKGRPAVLTDRGRLEGDVVVIAAGSWSSLMTRAALTPAAVRPIKGQLLRLRSDARVASRILWGRRCYIVPWPDGTTLVGATVEDVGFDERATTGAVRELMDAAVGLLPSLEASTFEEVRVGLRPLSADELPVIGRSASLPGVVYATGHYRNGVLLAPLTASLVADLVLENRERSELALTRPERLGL